MPNILAKGLEHAHTLAQPTCIRNRLSTTHIAMATIINGKSPQLANCGWQDYTSPPAVASSSALAARHIAAEPSAAAAAAVAAT